MEEVGQVISKKGEEVTVRFTRSRACRNCGICFQVSEKDMQTEAIDKIGVEIGDSVLVSLESGTFLKAAFILYVIPLLFLFMGIITGFVFSRYIIVDSNETVFSIIGGVIFLFLSYVLVKRQEYKASETKTYRPYVLKVVGK